MCEKNWRSRGMQATYAGDVNTSPEQGEACKLARVARMRQARPLSTICTREYRENVLSMMVRNSMQNAVKNHTWITPESFTSARAIAFKCAGSVQPAMTANSNNSCFSCTINMPKITATHIKATPRAITWRAHNRLQQHARSRVVQSCEKHISSNGKYR